MGGGVKPLPVVLAVKLRGCVRLSGCILCCPICTFHSPAFHCLGHPCFHPDLTFAHL